MRRMNVLVVLSVLIMLMLVMPGVSAQDVTEEPFVVTVTPYPTVYIQSLPPDEAIPVGAQTVFGQADDPIDYTTIISVVIGTLGLVVIFFGGALVVQGRQLLNASPPWMKEILISAGEYGLKRAGEFAEGTTTKIDDEAVAELKKFFDELTANPEDLKEMLAWFNEFKTSSVMSDATSIP